MSAGGSTLHYVEPVNPNLICVICSEPFSVPVQAPCGHTFCQDCVLRVLDAHQRCPACRQPLAREQLSQAGRVVVNMVEELLVKCTHAEIGCTVTPQRSLLNAHLNGSCLYHVIPCPNASCPQRLQRLLMQEHETVCPFRMHTCAECGESVAAGDNGEHRARQCASVTILCSDCSATVMRGGLAAHQQECALHRFPCPCERFGCTVRSTRDGQAAHAAICAFIAMEAFLLKYESDNDALRQSNMALRQRIEQLESDMELLHRERELAVESRLALRQENDQMHASMDAMHEELRSFATAQNAYRVTETMQIREELDALQQFCRASQMQISRLTAELQSKQVSGKSYIRRSDSGDNAHSSQTNEMAGKL